MASLVEFARRGWRRRLGYVYQVDQLERPIKPYLAKYWLLGIDLIFRLLPRVSRLRARAPKIVAELCSGKPCAGLRYFAICYRLTTYSIVTAIAV